MYQCSFVFHLSSDEAPQEFSFPAFSVAHAFERFERFFGKAEILYAKIVKDDLDLCETLICPLPRPLRFQTVIFLAVSSASLNCRIRQRVRSLTVV